MSSGEDISSADPAALRSYSDTGLRMDAALESSSVRLAAVLALFEATCVEFRTGVDPRLAMDLRDHVRRTVEHDQQVGWVAAEFDLADRRTALLQPSPSAGIEDGSAKPTEVAAGPPVGPDFLLSRAIDAATEFVKSHIQPRYITRLVPEFFEVVSQEVSAVLKNEQVVAYSLRQTSSWVLTVSAQSQLANGPAMALKTFLGDVRTGVPIVGGIVQGATDAAMEPELSPSQRAGRIVVAGALSIAAATIIALTLPEDAVVLVAVGAAIGANSVADIVFKPLLFNAFGLNSAKRAEQHGPDSASIPGDSESAIEPKTGASDASSEAPTAP